MSTVRVISSRENAEFRALLRLVERPDAVREAGRVVLSGTHLVDMALSSTLQLDQFILAHAARENAEIRRLLGRRPDADRIELTDSLFKRLSDVSPAVGLACVMQLPVPLSPAEVLREDAVVLDGVQDPGNVGSIMRTALASGIRTVILGQGCAAAWSPKVLRAGQGAQLGLRIAESVPLEAWLEKQKLPVIGLAPGDGIASLYELPLTAPHLWVMGSEGQGISPSVMARLSVKARIPMAAGVESLNVGAAAAIALFEAVRQRHR